MWLVFFVCIPTRTNNQSSEIVRDFPCDPGSRITLRCTPSDVLCTTRLADVSHRSAGWHRYRVNVQYRHSLPLSDPNSGNVTSFRQELSIKPTTKHASTFSAPPTSSTDMSSPSRRPQSPDIKAVHCTVTGLRVTIKQADPSGCRNVHVATGLALGVIVSSSTTRFLCRSSNSGTFFRSAVQCLHVVDTLPDFDEI